MDWWALAAATALCLAMAAAEAVFTAATLPAWLAGLRRPRLYAPMWLWAIAAGATYLGQGVIAYRLIAASPAPAAGLALVLLAAVMAANVGYNVALARRRSAQVAYRGVLWFLPLLVGLQLALAFADAASFWIGLAYAAWVVLYDVPITRALALLNPDSADEGSDRG